jgi:HlyD family secretion protein
MMRWIGKIFLSVPVITVVTLSIAGVVGMAYEQEIWPFGDHRPLRERFPVAKVHRSDLNPVLSVSGRLESSKRTVVRCELENLGVGGAQASGGASVLLEMLPEGSVVKRGDVLARIDASGYEELVRQQAIVVEQAKASFRQAELDHQIAILAVREYREGTVDETVKGMEGSMALAKSDVSRANERLAWTSRMREKGYASVNQILTDKITVKQGDFTLQKQSSAYDLFLKFTVPKMEKTLNGQVQMAKTALDNEELRLRRQQERFDTLKLQVDRCTIRAPHDGVLFYANDTEKNLLIEEGMAVRQKQALFFLPDLNDLEVIIGLNESVVDLVTPGQLAHITVESKPGVELTGRVASMGQVPVQQGRRGEDIRFFMGSIKVDKAVPGLKPGMTVGIEIGLGYRPRALVVPQEAVVLDGKRKLCNVVQGDHAVTREIAIGQGTADVLEVLDGLKEGDEVILNPALQAARVKPLNKIDDKPSINNAPKPESLATSASR